MLFRSGRSTSSIATRARGRARSSCAAVIAVDGNDVTRPWAIELAGGQRCVVTNGTAPVARGVSLGYLCTDGAAGLRQTTAKSMSALYRATDGAIAARAVLVAWRGAPRAG